MKDNKLYNIHGQAYGEYKDAFVRTFEVFAEDECGDEVHLNAMHQTVCLDNRRFFDSVVVFGDDFFDDGVLAYDIDVNGHGLDASDFDGVLRGLVVEALLGKHEYAGRYEDERRISDSVEYEYTNDGNSDTILKAMFHYDKVA